MTTTLPCVRGCVQRGQHTDHCTDTTCTGCRPRNAAHRLLVCHPCETDTRNALRDLPDLWDQVLDAAILRPPTRGTTSSGNGRPTPLDPDGAAWRDRARLLLHAWARQLAEPAPHGRALTIPPDDTIRRLTHHLAVHAGWLLAHPQHADQLVADLFGFTDHDDPDQPVKHEGLVTEGRRLAYRSRGAALTIRCSCGERVPVDPDPAAIMRCRGCGEWGTLDWWRRREIGDDPHPMTLRELAEWLLLVHALNVPERRLRDWADEGIISPVQPDTGPDAPPAGPGRPARRFDPVTVAATAMQRQRAPRRPA